MRVLVAFLTFAGALGASVRAQTVASLGIGVGTVRYAGGANQNSVSLTPGLEAGGPSWTSALGATLASLPGAEWYGQGRASFWGALPVAGRFRVGGDVDAIGTVIVPDSLGTNSAESRLTAEALWSERRWGVGVGGGVGIGWIEGTDSGGVTAGRGRIRGWWDPAAAVALAATVEPTYFLGAWYTDLSMGVTGRHGPVTLTLWTTARVSAVYGSKAAASADIEWKPKPFLTVAVGGGSYLPNPYQGFPAGTFFTAGLRFHTRNGGATATRASTPSLAPLVPSRRGDTLVVRFAMPNATSVAIAGDWNVWQPTPLSSVGEGIWEAALLLAPGTYHFNLLVDAKDWVVPGGVATVPDGLGGKVAVLTVF